MSDKGSFWDNPFGGVFDFNGDGKEDLGEQFVGYKIFEECTKEENESDDDFDSDIYDVTHSSDKYEWRTYCEDGFEFGVFPEHYETEDEYEEALNEAKYGWRDNCESVIDTGIDPDDYETEYEYNEALEEARDNCDSPDNGGEISLSFSVESPALDKLKAIKESDYPNKRRYNAALTLANEFLIYSNAEYEKKDKDCCRFIIDKADTILAANYLSHSGGFLYSQAIKDNFSIPCSLPYEDETREMEFSQILCKIAKRDIPLSLEIWSWCLDEFLPYSQYDDFCVKDLSADVIDSLYNFPDGYRTKLIHYMSDNDNFCKSAIMSSDEPANSIPQLIAEAIKEKLSKTAKVLFKYGLEKAGDDWKKINALTGGVILWCKNYKELESMEFFRDNLFPLVKAINIGMVQDEIEEWEQNIAEYIDYAEKNCEQYAMTRSNAWRASAPDGSKYGIDPRFYNSEEEYLAELNEYKYSWRKRYNNRDTYGLDVNDFETQEEFYSAFNKKLEERRQKQRDEREKERRQKQAERQNYAAAVIDDKNIYTICGVVFPNAAHPYHYRTEDTTLKIGDTVLVPAGEKEAEGRIVSVGQYTRQAAPFPIDKMKTIISKV